MAVDGGNPNRHDRAHMAKPKPTPDERLTLLEKELRQLKASKPGKPGKPLQRGEKLSAALHVKVTPSERERVAKAAREAGYKSVGAYVLANLPCLK